MTPETGQEPGKSGDPMRYRMRFLILTILAISPAHGYDIAKKIQEITAGTVKPSPGSIYPVLHELAKEGLVEEEIIIVKGRARKIYKLTEKGMEYIARELDLFTEIMNGIMTIITEVRKSVQERLRGEPGGCIPPRILEGLKRLREGIDAYIRTISREGRICDEGG
jgi:PadR family transcriptional regulator PadR